MKLLLVLLFPFFSIFGYGLFLSQYEIIVLKPKLQPSQAFGLYDYNGVTHVHLNDDSEQGFEKVAQAAYESGLDFIFLTPLNSFDRSKDFNRYANQVLVLSAGEYSFKSAHLVYLAKNSDAYNFQNLAQAQAFFSDKTSLKEGSELEDDLIILAHPLKEGYEWTTEIPNGISGLEIANLNSYWEYGYQEERASSLWSFYVYFFNRRLSVLRFLRDPNEEIEIWDRHNADRKLFAFSAADATNESARLGRSMPMPSYDLAFETVSNHVQLESELTGDPERDKIKLLDALRNGHFYIAFDLIAPSDGFVAVMSDRRRQYRMGSTVKLREDLKLSVILPSKPLGPFETVIIKDGQRFATSNSQESEFFIHVSGVYRIWVRFIPTFPLPDGKKWITWIYTNAFYVE